MNRGLRQSNFELLRIVAMFFIVIGHFMAQGNYFSYDGGVISRCLALFLGNASRIFVNVFLFIGIWFMVDSKFSSKRIIKLYLNTWIYTFTLAIIVLLLGFKPEIKYVITGIIPFIGKNLWFVSTYIALLLLSPWLQKVLTLNKKSLRRLVIVLFVLVSGFTTIWEIKGMDDGWLNGLVWFIFVYIFIGYFKRFSSNHSFNKYLVLVVGLFTYICLVYIHGISYVIDNPNINNPIVVICGRFLADYKSIPNFFIAMCIFVFFQNIDLGNNKIINYIASGSFATYVIHQTHVFIPVLWYKILRCDYFFSTNFSLLYCIIATCMLYTTCLVIERLRIRYLEPIILTSKPIEVIEKKLDHFFQVD